MLPEIDIVKQKSIYENCVSYRYSCAYCDEGFYSESAVTKHVQRRHWFRHYLTRMIDYVWR